MNPATENHSPPEFNWVDFCDSLRDANVHSEGRALTPLPANAPIRVPAVPAAAVKPEPARA